MAAYTGQELAEWAGGAWSPAAPERVAGVNHDTRTIGPGEVFVALAGPNHDGHAFVDAAFAAGACGAVVQSDRRLAPAASRPLLVVADTRVALRRMGLGYRCAVGATVIAVTGTAGKSSVKELVGQTLSRAGTAFRTPGNWNNDIGLPLSILAMPRDARFAVLELGMNHPGEIRALCAMSEPDWAIVTNIGPGHIGEFGSLDAIADEKANALRALPTDGRAFLWRESQCIARLRGACRCAVTEVSLLPGAAYTCAARDPATGAIEVVEAATGDRFQFRLGRAPEHLAVNALLATAVARAAGMPWDAIREGLEAFRPLPMRGEELRAGGVLFVNDTYNANRLSMAAGINAFHEMPVPGRKWLVLGDMLELGSLAEEEHRQLGAHLAGLRWAGLILVGDLAVAIGEGAAAKGFARDRIHPCSSGGEAVEFLAANLTAGDGVLVKASRGAKLERVIEELAGRKGGAS